MFLSHALPRSVVRIAGKDRVKHLHSFCTADIRAMQTGDIREAMILDTKGKLKCLVHVLCREESLELNGVPDQAAMLISHLDMYVIREDVRFEDCSGKLRHTFFFPATKSEFDPGWNKFSLFPSPEGEITACHADFAGPGLLIQSLEDGVGLPADWNELATANPCSSDSDLQLHRITQGCPWFGVDCNESNLPQELQRDDRAISFTKGCYLGQETVARIDALGRVNQLLVVVRSSASGAAPQIGSDLKSETLSVGKLTSVVEDAETGHWLGLALVKRKSATPGMSLDSETGAVLVASPTEKP